MVDVASSRAMPSEPELHVARSFLTKILRSSMRKNDLGSRAHSWHPSRLTEEESEPGRREAPPDPVWPREHKARFKESSSQEDQIPHGQLTSQLGPVINMEKLDHPCHPYPPGRLSPTTCTRGSEPHFRPAARRDSGFSCFSGSSSPPVHDLSTSARRGPNSEHIFFKGVQGNRPQQDERPRYIQPTLGSGNWEGSWVEERPASRVSVAGRPSINPVWRVPEKQSQSPPPPPTPLHSDGFSAIKVFPFPEGPGGPSKTHGRSVEKLTEVNQNIFRSHQDKTPEARRSYTPLPTKEFLDPSVAADLNQNQLHPNRLFSLSSNDVRQSPYTHLPAHQRQFSDESPIYLQTRSATSNKMQSVGSYYRSLQDVLSLKPPQTASTNPNLVGGRHCSLASRRSVQTTELQSRQGKVEVQRGETAKHHWISSEKSGFLSSLKTDVKVKNSLPQSHMPYSENKEPRDPSHVGNGLHYDQQISEQSVRSHSLEDAVKRGEGLSNDMKRQFPAHPSHSCKLGLSRHRDPWVPQEDHRISPLRTPHLHSLIQESGILTESQPPTTTTGVRSTSDAMAMGGGKVNRRSDRYSTTLRKEIQQKRAQLQKSRSAATLMCDVEDNETEEWRSTETCTSSGVCFTSTYKDHLKEAQARVLQATSFQRRDLEPIGSEAPVGKVSSNGRIRAHKHFSQVKRTHSFSEPDKIDKVGVEGELQTAFGEQKKFFEAKPSFSRPDLKSSLDTNSNMDLGGTRKTREATSPVESAHPSTDPCHLSLGQKQVFPDQQRLGTFAEYQTTWSKQKKSSEAKTQGRYHSAENILDTAAEEDDICVHERSRSSPSADFCTQNIPVTWRDPEAQQSPCSPRSGFTGTCRGRAERRQRLQPDHSPVPCLPDHRTKPDSASPSGPVQPSPASQQPAQPPQTKSLHPSPRPSLGPKTTSSSQEFLFCAQAEAAALQPQSSSDTQHHALSLGSSPSPTPVSSPHLSRMTKPDVSKGRAETERENLATVLPLPVAEPARSPSPHFSPLRLTDEPPAVQEGSALRSAQELMDVKSPVRKVPVRIVSSSHGEGRAYLPQNPEACGAFQPPPPPYVASLGAAEYRTSSMFSAYTRQVLQDSGQASVPESSSVGAQRSEEDAKTEELARNVMGRDKSLLDILDQRGRKTTMDLMEGLFPPEEQVLQGAHECRLVSVGSKLPTSSPRSTGRREEDVSGSAAASLVPSSSYYNTSAPKAELLIKMKDMQEQLQEQDSEDELDVDLAFKKNELISSLTRKLDVLREARRSLQDDMEDNETLGREVEATVQRLCQPNQLDKFRMFVGDLDKVVSLLLSLSGRLARVENALNSLEDEASPEEKKTLMEKRELLMRQHEDAKELKENLDRRERLVYGIMEAHLDTESLDDYCHFVKMKSALIIEQRKLEDKIKLGEEQLKCLVDSLPLEQRPQL